MANSIVKILSLELEWPAKKTQETCFGLSQHSFRNSDLDSQKDTGTNCHCRCLTPRRILRLVAKV